MSFHSWLQNLRSTLAPSRGQRHHGRRGSLRAATHRPNLEVLEDRCLLSFSSAASFPVGDNPLAVATGHFNNDNHLDLVTANYSDSTVSVRFGDGQGGFGAANPFATGTNPVSVVVGDFNNDTKDDLATANLGSGDMTVLLGDGLGDFEAPVSIYLASGDPRSLAVGDFDNDGKMDLAVGTSYTYSYGWYSYDYAYVEVLMGDGQGGFGSNTWYYIGTGSPVGLAVDDLDNDLDDDVVAVNPSANTVSVLLGSDSGMMEYGGFPTGLSPQSVAVGDFTGDGILDLVTAGQTVNILQGDGAGGFTSINNYATGSGQTAVAAADLNNDGNLDVVTVSQGAGTVSAFLGLGDGTLALAGDHAVGSSPRAVALGDFNGDARPDVAAANAGSDNASLLLNDGAWSLPPQPPPPSIAISDVTVTEGNTGTVNATFTLTLSEASTVGVMVHYDTADISAAAGSDYTAASGDVIIPAGQTSATFTVAVKGDRLAEPTETFAVNLSAPTNATIGDGQGIGTILDNEPRISISDVTRKEGNGKKTTLFVFTVTLSAAYDQAVTMSYRTVDGTATTSDGDYIAKTGTLTFAPGETTKTITIEVKGDSKREANETFYLDLFFNSSNSLFTKNRGLGTILNDD